ncbi:MAG: diguanylate cyclase [Desulfohalobiaceae bacterium]
MTDKGSGSGSFDDLRQKAEALLREQQFDTSGYPNDILELVHELQVNQTELEIQNEELRNAQEELSRLHREFEDLYEFAPCGYITINDKGIITRCNLSGVSLLGYVRSNLKYKTLSGFVSRQSQEDYFAALKRAAETGEQQSEELKIVGENKASLWVRCDIRADTVENETVEQWRLTLMDITDRVMAQQGLMEKKRELGAIYENAPLIMLVVDRNLMIRTANRFAAQFFDVSQDRLSQVPLGEVFSCRYYKNDPRGCGMGLKCEHCAIKNALIHTFETGRSTDQSQGTLYVRTQGEDKELSCLVSSSLIPRSGESLTLLTIIDITERVRMENKLRYASFHDSLTGLYNRNFFQEEMHRLQKDPRHSMGLLLCDLDGMKFVNDTLGHAKGDEMIKRAAELLQENFRASDIIARIGGDEFAVIVPDVDREETESLVQRLRDSAEENNRLDPEVPVSLSIGYLVNKESPADMEALFREADNRMYQDKVRREQSARSVIVEAFMRALESRDFLNEGHSERLQEIMEALARSMGLSEEYIASLRLLARYHDVGKLVVPYRILFKPGPLNSLERREMQQHSEVGSRIAQSVPEIADISDWVLKHHERWDGSGYPMGLAGDDIPLACRILALAETYDALVNDRPSGEPVSREEALEHIRLHTGTQFDPVLTEKFIAAVERSGGGERFGFRAGGSGRKKSGE